LISENRLILIEGLPGVGKTTLAERLTEHFEGRGKPCICLYENDQPHPLQPPWHDDPQQMAARFVECWRDYFSSHSSTNDLIIAEAALFQTVARVLLQQSLAAPLIDRCLLELSAVLEPHCPLLIHFNQVESRSHTQQLCRERGRSWTSFLVEVTTRNQYAASRGYEDFAGVLQFMADYQRRSEHWFEVWPLQKIQLSHHADWEQLYRELGNELGLAEAL